MAAAFKTLRGSRRPAVLLTCEHAENRMPRDVRPSADQRRRLAEHWGWDPGGWDVTRGIHRRLNVPAVGSRLSRLWIDLNRAIGDPSMFREEADGVVFEWNRGLDVAERRRRIDEVYRPYHDQVDRLLVDALLHGVRPLVFAIHTFSPRLGRRRRPFDIGVLYERSPGPARVLAKAYRDAGLRVRYNEPYSGREGMMYSAERHAATHALECLELECNQELFERPGAAERIAEIAARALTSLNGSAPAP